jgi:ribulose-bisphosphate carboxylase large chain
VKPSIGLTPEKLSGLVGKLAVAGIDFLKDEELNANQLYAPLEYKVKVVMEAIERAAVIEKKLMYAFNITGGCDGLQRNHDLIVKAGGALRNDEYLSILSIRLAGLH